MSNSGVSLAKQWLKCFRTEYYQYIDNITFTNEEEKLMSTIETKTPKLVENE
jgi:hypothetical protein